MLFIQVIVIHREIEYNPSKGVETGLTVLENSVWKNASFANEYLFIRHVLILLKPGNDIFCLNF